MTVFNKEHVDTKTQPMFFGKPLGVQRYDSYKYPVFDKLTTQMLGYFWRPEEVSLQKDRGDYQSLRPEQKHIFTSNLKYQILLDSVQGRGPGMAFAPYCALPELEGAMNVWQFMEMIHSRSYTYIIKNVYPDPAEVFDTILDDDKILARAQSVTAAYDDFINMAHQYDQSNCGDQIGNMQVIMHRMKRKNSNVNFILLYLMSIYSKVFVFMLVLLAVLHLENSNSWKVRQKSSHLLQETRTNIQSSLNK